MFRYGFFCFILSAAYLFTQQEQEASFKPWKTQVDFIAINDAKFKTKEIREQKIHYSTGGLQLSKIKILNTEGDGFVLDLGYRFTRLKWDENPVFEMKTFNDGILSLGGFTKRINKWLWFASMHLQMATHKFDLAKNTRYRGILQGRYTSTPNTGIYFGVLVYTNLKKDEAYPILGIDYQKPQAPWRLKILFPIESNLEYDLHKTLTLSLNHRFIRDRHRVEFEDRTSEGIFDYSAQAVDIGVQYLLRPNSSAKIYFGSSLPGEYKTGDKDYQNKRVFNFKNTWHYGGSFVINF